MLLTLSFCPSTVIKNIIKKVTLLIINHVPCPKDYTCLNFWENSQVLPYFLLIVRSSSLYMYFESSLVGICGCPECSWTQVLVLDCKFDLNFIWAFFQDFPQYDQSSDLLIPDFSWKQAWIWRESDIYTGLAVIYQG